MEEKYRDILPLTIGKELRIEGFVNGRWVAEHREGVKALAAWITQGKIKVRETVVEGFVNTPKAFFGLFDGSNTGKMIVKV